MTPNPNAARDRAAWRAFREPSEAGYQAMQDDHGNWYRGQLIGTCHGVTPAVLASWRGQPITSQDMQNLSWDEADQIADADYWQPVGGDFLPSGVNIMVADFGWGSGPITSARMLQTVLGFTGRNIDGIVGPRTMLACQGTSAVNLINELHNQQAAFYLSLGSRFLKGWDDRNDRRRDLAKTLIS